MSLEIQSGIAMPEKRTRKVTPTYPFACMQVNDSFYIADVPYKNMEHVRSAVMTSAKRYGRKNNTTYQSRRDGQGIRVWRVA